MRRMKLTVYLLLPLIVAIINTQLVCFDHRYARHNRPNHPISYSFTDWGENFMLLVPPSNASPSYKISASLNLNPFLPISTVTKVEMILSETNLEELQFVGEFEVSLHHTRGVLSMVSEPPIRLSNVVSSASRGDWFWTHGDVRLRWDCRTRLEDGSPMCICYGLDGLSVQLATFIPPPVLAPPPLPDAILTIFPDGFRDEFFEHILISILVIQRKTTMLL
ncbi:hypothetical protein BT96DRAFT_29565 [Gymnopus androsaceus JB14]|uniref:Uncharacterized protein n=1 Tax=Gymnopus androsaceus JB14 TaxID=1447944 RepID=A0A6A4ICJ1_9AGAR|nr:hypothetical protein BT96DRAFT_29565 [Gymnopus androsaceus JB14]